MPAGASPGAAAGLFSTVGSNSVAGGEGSDAALDWDWAAGLRVAYAASAPANPATTTTAAVHRQRAHAERGCELGGFVGCDLFWRRLLIVTR